MNCVNHSDKTAVAYCRTCGKALCEICQRTASGTIYCEEHAPAAAAAPPEPPAPPTPPAPKAPDAFAGTSPYETPGASSYTSSSASSSSTPPPHDPGVSPGLAFVLGMIPGVGAIYNGQYVKGVIHVVILGVLISIVSSDSTGGMEPLFGMLIAVWWFYMAFEAYHTARRRQMGQYVDEFSSIVPMHGRRSGFPIAPVVLIGIGILFLLNTMDIIRFHQLIRYWPVALIVLGGYMLYERITGSSVGNSPGPEVFHERR